MSFDSASRNGTSSWQGTHHEAQTFTSVTASLKVASVRPGTGLPSRVSSGSGGRSVGGIGWPISAEGMREGSPLPRRNRNKAASARKTTSGSSTRRWRRVLPERLGGGRAHDPSVRCERRVIAALLEIAENAALRQIIENDPGHQRRDHEDRDRVGGDDEVGVRSEIHACDSCACISRMVRTRRRRISLRMAARCKVTNSNVKASAMIASGHRIEVSMVEPPARKIDWP